MDNCRTLLSRKYSQEEMLLDNTMGVILQYHLWCRRTALQRCWAVSKYTSHRKKCSWTTKWAWFSSTIYDAQEHLCQYRYLVLSSKYSQEEILLDNRLGLILQYMVWCFKTALDNWHGAIHKYSQEEMLLNSKMGFNPPVRLRMLPNSTVQLAWSHT